MAPRQLKLTRSRAAHDIESAGIESCDSNLPALFEIHPPPAAFPLGCPSSSPTSAVEIACPKVQAAHG